MGGSICAFVARDLAILTSSWIMNSGVAMCFVFWLLSKFMDKVSSAICRRVIRVQSWTWRVFATMRRFGCATCAIAGCGAMSQVCS